MRRLPPLAAVRVFEAAARHENFTRAAAELGMTQAAVSYQIRLLEERVGVRLFHRVKRRVTLTEAGQRAAAATSGALDAIADAFSIVAGANDGVLAISTTATFATRWLAGRLGGFHLARPDLAVRMETDNALVDFAGSDVDVAIRGGDGGWPGMCEHRLFGIHWTVACSPAFLRRHDIETPADFLAVPRINPNDDWWTAWFEAAGVVVPDAPPRRGFWLDGQASEGAAALAGQGAATLSPAFWREELASGQLVQPFDILVPEAPHYWLVYPEGRRNQPKIRAFRDWLLAEAGQ